MHIKWATEAQLEQIQGKKKSPSSSEVVSVGEYNGQKRTSPHHILTLFPTSDGRLGRLIKMFLTGAVYVYLLNSNYILN